ncbi:DUF4244 domain-containing protein [Auraticoccus monumenti]|uniref:DUF4244 domain-containing protein n=1 Tax=Auraticoccus monumenti TaxID=675864 RepID=A0A1G6S0K5_9ACTN|nr:DUF4244 domain-containing protein [Auraticoccus monumenti]SDD10194.1 Protein of unknown function [Auraticoccus monumenti]
MSDHEVAVAAEDAEVSRASGDERGMTTAEYAVGTVAAVSFGGVLIKILTDENIRNLILQIILWILETISGVVMP